ncbi:MAG: hypothetical protein KC535_03125 [Nanoarchaeota archaeon]|nr:hypothetical protein [Nanoarchaeota archaeon]
MSNTHSVKEEIFKQYERVKTAVKSMTPRQKVASAIAGAFLIPYAIQTARLNSALDPLESAFDNYCAKNESISLYKDEGVSHKLYYYVDMRNQFLEDNQALKGFTSWKSDQLFTSSTITLPIPYNPLSVFKPLNKTALKGYADKK